VANQALGPEFPYRSRWTTIVFAGLFFAACALMLIHASTQGRGLILNGSIRLDPGQAAVFYEVLAGLCVVFVIGACLMACHRLTVPQRLTFGPSAMRVPASGWSRETRQIAYCDIRKLSLVNVSRETFLEVHHARGKVTILASMLPSRQVFEEVRALLVAKTG
jgi:hypothetical protein